MNNLSLDYKNKVFNSIVRHVPLGEPIDDV